jgi:hypothetical protein
MIINATEVKNSFGKMLKLLDYKDIYIKKGNFIEGTSNLKNSLLNAFITRRS